MAPKTKLLYIEASDLIQGWVIALLQQLNCETTQARTLSSARSKIEKETPFNLILLGDLTRPTDQVSGVPVSELSIIKSIRERVTYKNTSIIIFSSANYETECMQHGANGFLHKPAGAVELEEVLTPHLSEIHQHRAGS